VINRSEHDLKRLFKAAAQAPRDVPAEVPFDLERRVLALWRSGTAAVDEFFSPLPLYRRALAFACVLVVVALAFYCWGLTQQPSDEVVIINSPVNLTYLP
jgi:hypothetical protein